MKKGCCFGVWCVDWLSLVLFCLFDTEGDFMTQERSDWALLTPHPNFPLNVASSTQSRG